jgi:hypothetical protein
MTAPATPLVFDQSGSYTWTCPPGVTSVVITCVGGGVSPGTTTSTVTVVPGTVYDIVVGSSGFTAIKVTTEFGDDAIAVVQEWEYLASLVTAIGAAETTEAPQLPPTVLEPSIVQYGDSGAGALIASGASTPPMIAATTIGNSVALLIQAEVNTTDAVTSVTSSIGTFTRINSIAETDIDNEWWWCQDVTGNADTVTVVTSGAVQYKAFVMEVSNAATAVTGGTDSSASSTTPELVVTPDETGDLVLVGAGFGTSPGGFPSPPWVDYDTGRWSAAHLADVAWQFAPSTSPITASWTQTAEYFATCGLIIKGAGFDTTATHQAVVVVARNTAAGFTSHPGSPWTIYNAGPIWTEAEGADLAWLVSSSAGAQSAVWGNAASDPCGLAGAIFAPTAGHTATLIQTSDSGSQGWSGASGTSWNLATPAVAGHALVAGIVDVGAGGVASVSDNGGSTWVKAIAVPAAESTEIWYTLDYAGPAGASASTFNGTEVVGAGGTGVGTAGTVTLVYTYNPGLLGGVTPGYTYENTLAAMSPTDLALQLTAMKAVGIQYLRLDSPWSSTPGSGHSSGTTVTGPFDAIAEAALAAGITPHMILEDWTGEWATGVGTFGAWCGYAAAFYASKGIHHFEIGNELNLGNNFSSGSASAPTVAALMQAVYPEIHAADSEAFVLLAGLAAWGYPGQPDTVTPGYYNQNDFMEALYANGVAGFFDAANLHMYMYSLFGGPDVNAGFPAEVNEYNPWGANLTAFYAIMVANGDSAKKVWFTELGVPTDVYTVNQQAAYVTLCFQAAATLTYAGPLFSYNWYDTGSGDDYGLYLSDGDAKPSAESFYAGTYILPGPVGVMEASTAQGVAGYPVLADTEYTVMAFFQAATTPRSCKVAAEWYASDGTLIEVSSFSTPITDNTSTPTQASVVLTSPAGTAYAAVLVSVASPAGAEEHYVSQIGIRLGDDSTWSPGGFVGLQEVIVTRTGSDGTVLFVRDASPNNPLPLLASTQAPGPGTWSAAGILVDYECVPTVTYTYSAQIVVTFGPNQSVVSPAATSNECSFSTTRWWEINPLDPPSAINAQMQGWEPQTTEASTAHIVNGQAVPNVVADVMGGQDGTATAETFTDAIYAGFQALLTSQATVFVQSPWGPIDTGYVRFGPQTGGLSSGSGNKVKDVTLMPSVVGSGHRSAAVTFVAQARPPV